MESVTRLEQLTHPGAGVKLCTLAGLLLVGHNRLSQKDVSGLRAHDSSQTIFKSEVIGACSVLCRKLETSWIWNAMAGLTMLP